jgi:hypothetical protein
MKRWQRPGSELDPGAVHLLIDTLARERRRTARMAWVTAGRRHTLTTAKWRASTLMSGWSVNRPSMPVRR